MNNSIRTLALVGLAAGFVLAGTLRADDMGAGSDQGSQTTDQQIQAMQATLATLTTQSNSFQSEMAKLMDNLKFDGDFRYRYEESDEYGVSPATRDLYRDRYRIKADLGVTAKINDFTKTYIQLSTTSAQGVLYGYGANNTRNDTIQEWGDKNAMYLGQAYMDIAPDCGGVLNPELKLGVQPVPFLKGDRMIFDSDDDLGGMVLSLEQPLGMGFSIKGIGTEFYMTEINGDDGVNDELSSKLEAAQGILGWDGRIAGAKTGLKFGAANYNFMNIQGTNVDQYGTAGFDGFNTLSGTNIAAPFDVDDYIADLKINLGGVPVHGYYDYAYNSLMTQYARYSPEALQNIAYIAGCDISSGKLIPLAKDELTIGGYYARVDTNSVVAILSSGDFNGGGVNAMGTAVYGKIKLGGNLTAVVTDFNDDGNLDHTEGPKYAIFQRFQADLVATF